MDHTPGRYNLQKLGWKAFEDLVIEVNRTILGASVTPLQVGADEGRDGFFKGQLKGEYLAVAPTAKSVVFQCKHTSSAEEGITLSDVKDEIAKVTVHAAKGDADLFVIFTNRRLRGENERKIREAFEAIPGVQCCRVFGEEWIESHIDGQFPLLRRVPRLYGIGDLSQILSAGISDQTRLILEEFRAEQAVFVRTPCYRDAVQAIEDRGLVVLVGAPASGKSAIALNLCVVFGAEDKDLEVLKIDSAEQFAESWSALDTKKLFWIDDFLGETTFDEHKAKPWSTVFDKIVTAWKAGNKFIFTTRDYILKEAHSEIKKGKLEFFEDRAVVVRVDNLAPAERARILYNHVKLGDLSRAQKQALKEHLRMLAELPGFSPELARRLGSARFHRHLPYTKEGLTDFVERPVHFFSDVIHDLGEDEQATISLLLLSNNYLADPVQDVPDPLKRAFGVSVADVRRALNNLKGSLTKLSVIGTHRAWQVHHPSMIDAMHQTLRDHGAMLDLFVEAAPAEVVLRDCATEEGHHRLFVPEELYAALFARVRSAPSLDAARFLARQGRAFIEHVVTTRPDDLGVIMADAAEVAGQHEGLRLLVKVESEMDRTFDEGRRAIEGTANSALWERGCIEVLWSEDFETPIGAAVLRSILLEYRTAYRETLSMLVERVRFGSRDFDDADELARYVDHFDDVLDTEAKRLLSADEYQEFARVAGGLLRDAREEIREYMVGWQSHLDSLEDEWRERRHDPPIERSERGIFSDVDE